MNILFINRLFYPSAGGVEKVAYEYAKRMAKHGHCVNVLTCRKNYINGQRYKDKETMEGFNVYRVPTIGNKSVSVNIGSLFLILKLFNKADIVHIQEYRFLFFFSLLYKIFSKKIFVFQPQGMFFHTKKKVALKDFLYDKVFLSLFTVFDAVIGVNKHEYARLKNSKIQRLNKKVHLVKLGVSYSFFARGEKKNITDNTLLYLGRISQNKGLDMLFNVLSEIAGLDYKLRIIGEGEESCIGNLKVLASNLKISDKITWLGRLSDENVFGELTEAKFLLIPSKYEGFGLVLLEAMASRTVAIVNKIDVFCDIIENSINGFILDFTETKKSAMELERIVNIPLGEVEKIGRKAQDMAKSYDWDVCVQEIYKIYDIILGRESNV